MTEELLKQILQTLQRIEEALLNMNSKLTDIRRNGNRNDYY